jgi:hypothetical protein
MRTNVSACLVSIAISAMLMPAALAQTRCEPTLAQPCTPKATTDAANSNQVQKPGESKTKLDPQPLLPDIKVDKDTSMGFGHGGVIGLERKF